jgi:hypothetical protein
MKLGLTGLVLFFHARSHAQLQYYFAVNRLYAANDAAPFSAAVIDPPKVTELFFSRRE